MTTCKQKGAKLLEIESQVRQGVRSLPHTAQEENDIMSELLFHSSKVTNAMDQVTPGCRALHRSTPGVDWWSGV